MDEYEIVFTRASRKELEALSARLSLRLLGRIESLTTDPRPRGCRKLADSEDVWRIRVGDHRVLYGIDDSLRRVRIIAVRNRKDAY